MSSLVTNVPSAIPERAEFEVIKNMKNTPNTLMVDGRPLTFGKSGGFKIKDPGLAHAIESLYGRDGDHSAMVIPIEKRVENGSPRTFLVKLPPNMDGRWKGNKE